jgi:hypothetical protein
MLYCLRGGSAGTLVDQATLYMHCGMPVSSSRCKTWYFSHFQVHCDMYSECAGFGGAHALQSEQLAGRATRSEPCGHAEHRWQRSLGM